MSEAFLRYQQPALGRVSNGPFTLLGQWLLIVTFSKIISIDYFATVNVFQSLLPVSTTFVCDHPGSRLENAVSLRLSRRAFLRRYLFKVQPTLMKLRLGKILTFEKRILPEVKEVAEGILTTRKLNLPKNQEFRQ